MTLNSSNVRVAVTGAIYIGGASAAKPTDADSSYGSGWSDLGYASENGVTESRNRTTQTIKGWQNGDVVREVVTEAGLTFKTVLIETKEETVGLYYGTTVDANGALQIVPSSTGGRQKFGFDIVDGDAFIRAYVASGEITEVGEQVYRNGEAIGYEVTIRAYPHADHTDPVTGAIGSATKWYSTLAGETPEP
ncbi:hypothetical protein EDD28_2393 [Salana multivorans]|uniref:Uncharacterized protein n=1 Tax=Salana multivorans TaxID=120377 RepID=A0A3N2DDB0_9MICO|nr:hypothetical protein [Salana multivorans]ROR97785.1 hypothetical protein EDD28_2393 [Salana multivorans]